MLIQVEHLTYTYAPGTPLAHVALQDVTLRIEPGERLGLVGATGSGKSTLVQLMAGLLRPGGGQVWLDGAPAHGRRAASRSQRRQIGLAFQYPEDQLFEPTVLREVNFGLRQHGLDDAAAEARARWALEMVGLDPAAFLERSPLTLSGGEMRRVALASVLALRPQVVILDEPTAGLDPAGRREVMGRVLAWQAQTGATLVLVSHHLGELAHAAERVVALRQGCVVADGPARQVLSDPDTLGAVGLALPAPAALLHALRGAGWDVRTDHFRAEDVAAEIARAWEARQ